MNVSAGMFREVAAELESLDEFYVASVVKSYAEKREAADAFVNGQDAKLAHALREAYYEGDEHSPVSSFPEQWLRMAEASRKQVEAELDVDVQAAQFVEREPRTWAKAAEVPDAVRFAERRTARGGSWVREGAEYRYGYSDGVTQGTLWPEYGVNEYAPFVEVLP